MIDPASSLSTSEASQIRTILLSVLEKLDLVGSITVDPHTQALKMSQSAGEEISRVIAEQRDLEAQFEQLIQARCFLRTMPNKSKYKDNQRQVQEVADQLRNSTMLLSRNLRENPNVANNMAKVSAERQSLQSLMYKCVQDLELKRSTPSLKEVVETESQENEDMRERIYREKATSAAVKTLRTDLKEEKIDHEAIMRQKKKALGSLKEGLKDFKEKTSVELRYYSKQVFASNETDRRMQNVTISDLESEIQKLNHQIEMEMNVHETTASFLEKKTTKMREQAMEWSQKHENDTQSMDRDREDLKKKHEAMLVSLKEMEEKYQEELALKEARELEARQEKERAVQQEAEQEREQRAATKIQALYRGWKSRHGGTKKSKGKGKGKK